MGRRGWALCALMLLCGGAETAGAAKRAPTASADWFTLEPSRPATRGQIELLTVSTLPDTVTGGDVLVEVRGLREGDRFAVRRNGRSVTAAFGPLRDGARRGLVTGLRDGANKLTAVVRRGRRTRRVASLTVRNHPVTGPVLSGPHQRPFHCQTKQSGLGDPLDEHCSIAPRVEWVYRTDREYKPLPDPKGPYPDDVQRVRTASGDVVPFVVRLETRTVNRGITRLAALDDPAARDGAPGERPSRWNRQLTYLFGESCGAGYHQGRAPVGLVLGAAPSGISGDTLFASIGGIEQRLARGDLMAFSSQSAFGVYCNPFVSIETLMMVSEHVTEAYGEPRRTLSLGGSGGALQQYNAINNAPGLIDGAMPIASFTDVVSTAMTVVDCGLLLEYWDRTELEWSDDARKAVAGHITTSICESWRETFLPLLHPSAGCSGIVPKETRYDAEKNPKGVRCTLQDALVNLVGRDPRTGFARRPYDNTGVQYGLGALNAGDITPQQFVDLNRAIGGYDLDRNHTEARSAMAPDLAARLYRLGSVIGRGSLDRAAILDHATYLDLIPVADIHDHVRPFQIRERLRKHRKGGATMSIWRGVSLYGDSYPAMDRWMDELERRDGFGTPSAIADARPESAEDRCVVGFGARADAPGSATGPFGLHFPVAPDGPDSFARIPVSVQLPGRTEAKGGEFCSAVFRTGGTPRTSAGGPLSDDVLKCSLKPVDPKDYAVALSDAELAELRRTFPDGVCDWSRPGVGEVDRSMAWPSLGATKLLDEPRSLRWRIARSRP